MYCGTKLHGTHVFPAVIGAAFLHAAWNVLVSVGWLFVLDALLFLPAILLLRGRTVFQTDRATWTTGALAALAPFGAYLIAVWAMTVAPIALVAALRETSILFAVLIGWLVFLATRWTGSKR